MYYLSFIYIRLHENISPEKRENIAYSVFRDDVLYYSKVFEIFYICVFAVRFSRLRRRSNNNNNTMLFVHISFDVTHRPDF